ncbi:hypothetical protein DFH11DRAFT_1744467 [Phellopilus nigrolimitatus]|nr:hypothetical protein DFH11DRAFT_1744467 [Phellopilus nigrolimitatus]
MYVSETAANHALERSPRLAARDRVVRRFVTCTTQGGSQQPVNISPERAHPCICMHANGLIVVPSRLSPSGRDGDGDGDADAPPAASVSRATATLARLAANCEKVLLSAGPHDGLGCASGHGELLQLMSMLRRFASCPCAIAAAADLGRDRIVLFFIQEERLTVLQTLLYTSMSDVVASNAPALPKGRPRRLRRDAAIRSPSEIQLHTSIELEPPRLQAGDNQGRARAAVRDRLTHASLGVWGARAASARAAPGDPFGRPFVFASRAGLFDEDRLRHRHRRHLILSAHQIVRQPDAAAATGQSSVPASQSDLRPLSRRDSGRFDVHRHSVSVSYLATRRA